MPVVGGHRCVTVEPIIREVCAYLDHGFDLSSLEGRLRDELAGPYALAEMIWPTVSPKTAYRRLYALMHEQRFVSVEVADRILCVLDRVHLWQTDPDLSAEYEGVRDSERELVVLRR